MYKFEKIINDNKKVFKSDKDLPEPILNEVLKIRNLIDDMKELEADDEDTSSIKSKILSLDAKIEKMFYEHFDEEEEENADDDDNSGSDNDEEKRKETINSTKFPHVITLNANKDKLSATAKRKHNMWNMQVKKYVKSGSEKVFESLVSQSQKLNAEYKAELGSSKKGSSSSSNSTSSASSSNQEDFQKQLDEKNRLAELEKNKKKTEDSEGNDGNSDSGGNFLGIDWNW